MSGTIVRDYNLALVQVTLGYFRVTGWGSDDGVTLAPMADDYESEASADGAHITVSRVNDPRWEMTLNVKRGSTGFKLLYDKLQAQLVESDTGAVTGLAITLYDPVSGDKIVEREGRFMRQPDMGFGKGSMSAEFKVLLPNPTITPGANIATSG